MFLFVGLASEPYKAYEEPHILQLVSDARSGHAAAFEELVFLYRTQVHHVAWQLCRNTEDAMDITQEAFLRAYNAIGSYKGRCKFSTWLHRIVLNTGIDYLRRESRHRHEAEENIHPAQDPSRAETQRQHIYNQELQKQVNEALRQLSVRQRQVFILRYYHDLEIKEAAKVLKCTEGAVKRHLYRAQARLKVLFSESGTFR